MPLYKKTTSKAKVKTQSSFISPLLSPVSSQNKIMDLLNDDYKDNIPIPTKKKLLEPLINTTSNDGDLLEKLQQKSFKNYSSCVEVSKNKRSEIGRDGISMLNKEYKPKFADLINDIKRANSSNLLNNSSKRAKSQELSKTNLRTKSPPLFSSSGSSISQQSNKRFKTEKSMTITTKIEISSNTHEDHSMIQSSSEDRMMKTTINDDNMDDENEFDSSIRSMLDDVVNANIELSQNMIHDASETRDENKNKQGKNNPMLGTKKSNTKLDVYKRTKKSEENMKVVNQSDDSVDSSLRSILDDVVKTNIILSQNMDGNLSSTGTKIKEKKSKKERKENKNPKSEMKKVKTKAELKQFFVNKDHIKGSLKSKEKIKSLSKSKEKENENSEDDIKIKSFKRIRALTSDDIEQPDNSKKESIENKSKKNKANDLGKKLKEKIKNKYLIEKEQPAKGKKNKNINNIDLEKEQNRKKKNLKAKYADKESNSDKLKKSSTITKGLSRPPNPKNMIFTSENPKKNKMDLEKLLKLQEERDVGLYVYCDTCDKVRYLPQCKDPLELPAKWYCYMNPDPKYNKCSDPDFEIEPEKEDIIIHNKYNAGSIVWAKMDGYPWWPAMVDDDPDLTDYFWLDNENSTEPSWYHVTFFDSSAVTRAWIRTANLEPFEINENNPIFKPRRNECYRQRVKFAVREAKAAGKMGILRRLRTYSFVVRYFKKCNDAEKAKKWGNKREKSKKTDQEHNNTNEEVTIDDFDDLSTASNEIISDILKPKKSGNGNIASDEEILDNINFNNFIYDEETFEEL